MYSCTTLGTYVRYSKGLICAYQVRHGHARHKEREDDPLGQVRSDLCFGDGAHHLHARSDLGLLVLRELHQVQHGRVFELHQLVHRGSRANSCSQRLDTASTYLDHFAEYGSHADGQQVDCDRAQAGQLGEGADGGSTTKVQPRGFSISQR